MIKSIKIRDFAIIKNTEFNFHSGLNIITGETGSGKSVVATAISLALGSRADTTFIRHGSDKAYIEMEANFDGIDYNIIREITSNGRNQCKINGNSVPLGRLVSLAENHAQIHGQFDNTSLLDPETHIDLLDNFGGRYVSVPYRKYINAYDEFTKLKNEYNTLVASIKEDRAKADFYSYAIQEIDQANLAINEDDELEERMSFLQNAEGITTGLASAYEDLSGGDHSADSLVGSAVSAIGDISGYTEELSRLSNDLDTVSINLAEVITSLKDILDSNSFSQLELDQTMERLALIDSLKKKYGDTIPEILRHRDELNDKLDKLENFDEEKAMLKGKLEESRSVLYDAAKQLTSARRTAGDNLSKSVIKQLSQLNFKDADLKVSIKPLKSSTPKGMDDVELFITTNKGEPLKPLAKVASGGEVSRIMLAIKAITAEFENISTLIFDEVDTGISGMTASIVGNKLKELGANHQVISITHLPQIAAKGDHNYRIYKEADDSETFTFVEELKGEDKVKEIARLLGGVRITEATMENARELIEQ